MVEKEREIGLTDPNSDYIISEIDGKVVFEDIIPGTTLRIEKEAGKKIQKYIKETKEESLLPQVIVEGLNGERNIYTLPAGCMLQIEDNAEIKAGDTLARISTQQIKVKDITGGLPKVTELFESRVPKVYAYMAKEDGIIRFKGKLRGKYILALEYNSEDEDKIKKVKYSIPTNRTLLVRDGEKVKKGQLFCSGERNPHDILRILGPDEVSRYLLNRIQEVYREQGVGINDKHISIIIKQMLSKVEIDEPGDTGLIIKQRIDKFKLAKMNASVIEEGGAPATSKPVLMGITKTALNTDSFIAAASFQETTRILTKAAIKGAEDDLVGLKENVIIGHMVPSGTGFVARQIKQGEENMSIIAEDTELTNNENTEVADKSEEVAVTED